MRERFIQGTGPFCYDIISASFVYISMRGSTIPSGLNDGGPTAPSRSNRSRKIAVMRVNYNRLIYRKRKRQRQMQKKRNNKKKSLYENFDKLSKCFQTFEGIRKAIATELMPARFHSNQTTLHRERISVSICTYETRS